MKLSRRNFLKNVAMGTAAAAAASVAASAGVALADEAAATSDQLVMPDVQQALNTGADAAAIQWADQAEVVVVGCGSGGAPAAIEAARGWRRRASCIEKMDWLGGCMRRCGGGLHGLQHARPAASSASRTRVTEQLLYDYMSRLRRQPSYDPDLLRTYVENCRSVTSTGSSRPCEEGGLGRPAPRGQWELRRP